MLPIKWHKNVDGIKEQVLHWVRTFIVELNICPFANHVLKANRLGIKVSHAENLEAALEAVMSSIYHYR